MHWKARNQLSGHKRKNNDASTPISNAASADSTPVSTETIPDNNTFVTSTSASAAKLAKTGTKAADIAAPNINKKMWLEEYCKNLPLTEEYLYNTVQCYALKSAADLSRHFLNENRKVPKAIVLPRSWPKGNTCYMCCQTRRKAHGLYVFCCPNCGNKNYEEFMRPAPSHLKDRIAVVTGGRTKIGYQTCVRLLRAGCHVIATSRFPERAIANYQQEFDYEKWKDHLHIYSQGLDFNDTATVVQGNIAKYVDWVKTQLGFEHIDILINIAAQTIRGIERVQPSSTGEQNRYGDSMHFPDELPNSWQLLIHEVQAEELEEVFRINAIAPCLMFQGFLPMLLNSKYQRRMVINTHAHEGLFDSKKRSWHPHTNMAKSALHQLTLMINRSRFGPDNKEVIQCCGIDPGWASIDEYKKSDTPFFCAPLTELDAATRLVAPLFAKYLHRTKFTVKHFSQIVV